MSQPALDRRHLLAGLAASAPLIAAGCGGGTDPSGKRAPVTRDAAYVAVERPRTDGSARAGAEVARGLSAFTTDVYARLAAEPGNVVCSPYSVVVALAMTRAGAKGATAAEMDAALRVGSSYSAWAAGLNWLDRQVTSRAGAVEDASGERARVDLETAVSVWGQRGLGWERSFLDVLAGDFGAGVHTVDYVGATERARRQINAWTAEHTGDRIEELLGEDVLDAATRLVLVQAIWLRAPWDAPFEKSATRSAPFTRRDGSTVAVPLMARTLTDAGYAAGDGWAAVTLPYAGRELAMTLVVPDEPGGITDVERMLAGDGLADLLASTEPGTVDLGLPRWSTRTTTSLRPVLEALGVRTAFTDDADLSGMTTEEGLRIGAVEHQAFVAVDERGTEAAAATGVVVEMVSAPAVQHRVRADRPFVHVVHDVATRTPLFIGRVDDPSV